MTTQTRVAIVTGGSKGIGAAIARRLAADGTAIVATYATNEAAAAEVIANIQRDGGQGIAIKADITDPAAFGMLFDTAEKAFGGVDILINNAGIMELSPLVDVDDAMFDRQMTVNLTSVFRGLREAGRRLRTGGRIISSSSTVIGLYQPTYSIYAATKGAIEAMTHVLAKELGPRGITVNAIAPGPIDTDMFNTGKSAEQISAIKRMNPFGRLGSPEEIAHLVAFLASPNSSWVSGQVIRANGGVV